MSDVAAGFVGQHDGDAAPAADLPPPLTQPHVWTLSGYPAPGVFNGAWACRFRLCHARGDGLYITTLGHQHDRGGRLEAVAPGFAFVTFVTWGDGEEEKPRELTRAGANDPGTAAAQHAALLNRYAEWREES